MPSLHPSLCWPFPAWSVVPVSVYLPWRPADVYCDGIEYSSYQYGLRQCWISHSGLAGCPPAAYSNIVSRIVIIGAEGAAEDSQIKKYIYLCFHLAAKEFHFFPADVEARREGKMLTGLGEHLHPHSRQQREDGGMMQSESQARPKSGMKACLDLRYSVFFSFFPALSLSHTYTWESRQLMCCL